MSVNDLPLDHAMHDELVIAGLAADDLDGSAAEAARRLVRSCPACGRLHEDLRALAAATAALPAPRRKRDFRLTEADAVRLRPAGWRGLLGALAGPRFAFVQPLGGALAALGLAGLLVATVPSVLQPSGAALSTAGSSVTVPAAAGSAAASPAASAGGVAEPGQAPLLTAPSAGASAEAGGTSGSAGSATNLAPSFAAGQAAPAPSAAGAGPDGAIPSSEAGESPGAASDAKAPSGAASPGAPEPAAAGRSGAEAASGLGAGSSTGLEPTVLLAAASFVLLVVGAGLFLLARSARRSASG
jgi:hypothetical protein